MIATRVGPRLLTRRPRWTTRRLSSTASDPLRILFCGSDPFSCASLRALDAEMKRGGLVKSLDVMILPKMAIGRGNKQVREVPVKNVAFELGLPIHQHDTFQTYKPPSHINLVIAVSFGRFVPHSVLRKAKYGGLNVHPSFLPDLRGAAPLHHALLQNRTHTGITVQTLDEKEFDNGIILAQTPRPGIPIPPKCTVPQLMDLVKDPAADLLVDSLRKGLYMNPVDIRGDEHWESTRAPKLTKHDQRIDWGSSVEVILRRLRVLGRLWSEVVAPDGLQILRVFITEAEEVEAPISEEKGWGRVSFLEAPAGGVGIVTVSYKEVDDGAVILALPGGGALRIKTMIDGQSGPRRAATVLRRIAAFKGQSK